MGRDTLEAGVQIRKYMIITTRLCYRSVCNHPFVVGILLLLLFLYRSFPFLFSLLVFASPVLVCTAVLLGTLLSFGEPINVPASEEEAKTSQEVTQLKTGRHENTIAVEEDECFSRDSKFTELRREIVKNIDEDPLLENVDRFDVLETDHDDVACSSMPIDYNSREISFEKQWIDEVKSESGNTQIEQSLSHGEILQTSSSEHYEDYRLVDGSVDVRVRDYLISSMELQKQLDEVLSGSLCSPQEGQYENFEDYISAEGSVDDQYEPLEPSLASWKQFDDLDDRLSTPKEVPDERFEDNLFVEGSSEAQMMGHLESSLRSWKQFGSDHDHDHDKDDESDFGSDGAESSSPDASMADIIPMLYELHPLIDDENLQAVSMERSAKSPHSSIHSDDESDQKEDETDDGKSDVDDDYEEQTEGGEEDPAKSVITWTEDDQKNLMDLGTSELERNQRLESLIARRRARKMTGDRNLIDLDGMDLPFPVAPISTRRHNPFDLPHDSFADLDLPPIPGSAPSVMLSRRNPFDLPYDSSEEKPDLTGDSFQQEFTELTQREAFNLREALFRRNETFSMGSTGFDFGRPSRFRPYFVPERTDSDVMSYASLQRQLSELSESKASSAAETESFSLGVDQEEKKPTEHDSAQEGEPISEMNRASVLVEHESQSSEDLDSLSGEEKEKDFVRSVLKVELGRASYSLAAASNTSETIESPDNRHDYREIHSAPEVWLSHSKVSHSDSQSMTGVFEVNHNTISSPLSSPKALNNVKMVDVDNFLVNLEQSHVNDVLNADIPVKNSSEPSVSDVTLGLSLEMSKHSRETEVDDIHPKEPIYDLSPLKKNHSLSSSSSDLQRETSGNDLYNLSRDLFVDEELNIHHHDVENISRHTKQDADDNDLTLNDIGEGSGVDITKFFSELNQLHGNPQSSIVTADEGCLSLDDGELKDTVSDGKVSLQDADQIFEDRSLVDMPSADGHEFSEDSDLAQEKKEAAVLADNLFPVNSILSCSPVELKEEIEMEMEVNQQVQVSSSSLKSDENEENDKLLFSLDENHFLPHVSDTHDPLADLTEQELPITHRKLEEVDQVDKVDELVNVLMHQEPQLEKLSDPDQSNISSSPPEDSETTTIAELTTKEHVQDILETRHAYIVEENHEISEGYEGSVADEELMHKENSEVKEMDEDLLSELDAIGDFSVFDMVPNLENSMIYPNTVIDSNVPAEVTDEVHSNIEMQFDHETLLGSSTQVGNLESERETKELNLDSRAGKVDADLPVIEAQSVEELDAFMREEVEVPLAKTQLLFEDTESGECASEAATLTADATFNSRELVSEKIQSDLVFLEEHDGDSDCRETVSETPVLGAEIIEQFGEDAEKLLVEELLVIEPSTVPAFEPRDLTESTLPMELESLWINRDIEDIQESFIDEASSSLAFEFDNGKEAIKVPVLRTSVAPEVASENQREMNMSEPLLFEKESDEMQESLLVGVSTGSALESEHQMAKFDSELLQLDEEVKETHKMLAHEGSFAPAFESEDQIGKVVSTEPLQLDRGIHEVQAYEPSGLEPEEEKKVVGPEESESSGLEHEEEKTVVGPEESEPSGLEPEEEKKVVGPEESEASGLEPEEEKKVMVPEESKPSGLEPEKKEVVGDKDSETSGLEPEEEKKVVEPKESEPFGLEPEEEKKVVGPEEPEPSSLEPEEEKKVVGPEVSEPSNLELEEEKKVVGPEESEPSSLEPEEKKEVVGPEESEPSSLEPEEEKKEEEPEKSEPSGLEPEEKKKVMRPEESEPFSLEPEEEKKEVGPEKSEPCAPETEEEKKVVGPEEFEPLQRDSVVEELREWHVVEETTRVQPEPLQKDTNFEESESLSMDRDIKEIQESLVKDQIEFNQQMEYVDVQASHNHQQVSHQQPELDVHGDSSSNN